MGERDEPAEVAVARAVLDEQSEVRAVLDRQLGARDRLDPQPLAGLGELHRAPEAVVVGERDRLIAVNRRGGDHFLGRRGAVEERVGGVGVKLDVVHYGASGLTCRVTACQRPPRRTKTSVMRKAWLRSCPSMLPVWR